MSEKKLQEQKTIPIFRDAWAAVAAIGVKCLESKK